MRPVLFSLFGLPVNSDGVSKALAAVIAAWLLGRVFARQGLPKTAAHDLVLTSTVWGFLGAKLYYLADHPADLGWHHLGSGFTWYGGGIP
jgi:phosphatidylglycerol:prolipoprotein diacylglycerol transferase